MKNTNNTKPASKRAYRKSNPMLQLVTTTKKNGKSHYILSTATNQSLYTLVNLEAMVSGVSTSSFLESLLMERYADRIKNFEIAFSNLRNLEGR